MRAAWPRDPFEGLAIAFAGLTEATPGFRLAPVSRPGSLSCTVSPIPIGAFNRVMGIRLSEDEVDSAIDAVRAAHAEAGVPGSWWLDPLTTPTGLDAALLRHGYHHEGTVPAMAILLDHLPAVRLPLGATLEWVQGRDQMRRTQAMIGVGFGMSLTFAEQMADRLAAIGEVAGGPTRVAVVSVNGSPVASATAATIGDVAGVYSVATLPHARGRGFGTAATLSVLHDARERGASMGLLESSDMGFPVYLRMGFRHVGDFRLLASG